MLLTSHYMADVQALCKRVIVIHHGRILFDGELAGLGDQFAAWKTLTVELEGSRPTSPATATCSSATAGASSCACRRPTRPRVTAQLLAERDVADLTVEDPPIEDVIELVFARSDRDASASAPPARSSTTTSAASARRSRASSSTASRPTSG